MRIPHSARAPGAPAPSAQDIIADPSVREPLKQVLRSWLSRDPLDAAEDAHLLSAVLAGRLDTALPAAGEITPPQSPRDTEQSP